MLRYLKAKQQFIHGVLAWVWLAQVPIVLATGLKNSVPYLVFVSIYANVAGHWAGWSAERD